MSEIEFRVVRKYLCRGCQRWITVSPCPACLARVGRALHLPGPPPPPPLRGSAIAPYTPTQGQIEEAAAEVRAGWSEADEVGRRAIPPAPATISQGVTLPASG